EIILIGDLRRLFFFGGKNRKNYRHYLNGRDINYIMSVETSNRVIDLNKNRGFALKRLALWLKVRIGEIISRRLSCLAAGILGAMVLGEKKSVPVFLYNSMIKSGTVHILVVSGFHVGLITYIILLFLKLIRIPRSMRFYIATFLLIIYCLMTGASTPAIRATLMAVIFMFAYFARREPDIYNSIAQAAIFILVFNTNQLFEIGFQLSFVSVISIIYLYPKIKSFLCPKAIPIKALRYMVDGCLVSFSAWLGTAGFIAYHFRMISPVAVLANIFIVPLASLITLCGFSLIAMELLFPQIGGFFAYSCEFIAMLLVVVNSLLIKIPGAYLNLAR
ncbi:MAG: ComEC/Rec2 family competence protein, partial [Candidatus Omnitrophota bacterium]